MLYQIALLAGAALITAPEPIDPAQWVTSDDYPMSSMLSNDQGETGIRVTVAPEGKPLRCEVAHSSGSSDLDKMSCSLIMRHGNFQPALDSTGQALTGVYRNWINWAIPGTGPQQIMEKEDLIFTVNTLPKGSSAGKIDIAVNVVVNAAGSIEACSRSPKKTATPLDEIACAQVRSGWRPTPATDSAGVAVRSIQSVRVGFETESPPVGR